MSHRHPPRPLLVAVLALLWFVLRTGQKPSRMMYPCQRAALATASLGLAPLFAALLLGLRRRMGGTSARDWGAIAAVCALVGVLVSGNDSSGTGSHLTPDSSYRADVYVVEEVGGPAGDHHQGVDDLIAWMGVEGKRFYRSAAAGPEAGPDGVVGAGDVVLIKVNQQWPQRGGTNTDVLRGLIARILEHPDGFTGEVVVVENTQARGSFNWAESNAEDHGQSVQDVVDHFAGLGSPVSTYLWDALRITSVGEYGAGDMTDGYVVGPWIPESQMAVSYPKFRTAGGHYVSLKLGIWDPGSSSYDDGELTFLNLPVLKCHSIYGVTASMKHHVGTMTTMLSTNTHNGVRYGALGSFLAQVRMPDLNILDCIYILARPGSGPSCTYAEATRVNQLAAGTDPVALDLWAAKNILVPTILANGYTEYPMQDPDDPSSIFRTYLDNATDRLLAAGVQVTNDLAQVDAHVTQAGFTSVPGAARPAARAVGYPNPTTGGSAIRFDLPSSGTVTLRIYDARGALVRTIESVMPASAASELRWDGRDDAGRETASGAYFYRIEAPGFAASGKTTIIR